MTRVRFRQHSALAIAGLVGFFGALPVATTRWYLAPILLAPLAVAAWAWRSGTDADQDGVTVRALLGQRKLPWARIDGFVPEQRRVSAVLEGGSAIRLPAVTPADLPTLLEAAGQKPAQ
jgi:hypothetical protein